MISAVAGTALVAALVMAVFLLPGGDDRTDVIQARIVEIEEILESASMAKFNEQDFEAMKRELERKLEALKESMR